MIIEAKEIKKPRAVKMGKTMWESLGEISKTYNISRGEIIRVLIKDFIAKEAKKPKINPNQQTL